MQLKLQELCQAPVIDFGLLMEQIETARTHGVAWRHIDEAEEKLRLAQAAERSSAREQSAVVPVLPRASPSEMPPSDLDAAVRALLDDAEFRKLSKYDDRREMIRRANAIGGPPLRLVPLATIERIGRIPMSHEGMAQDALDLIEAVGADKCEIFFLSHRWLRAAAADTTDNVKARALVEFGKWRKAWVEAHHEYTPTLLFWIDVACVRQEDLQGDLAKLPLAVACCERMVTFYAEGYFERGWCRIEQLLAARFGFADHQAIIDAQFTNCWPETGVQRAFKLLDPSVGRLSSDHDRVIIRRLAASATTPGEPVHFVSQPALKAYDLRGGGRSPPELPVSDRASMSDTPVEID